MAICVWSRELGSHRCRPRRSSIALIVLAMWLATAFRPVAGWCSPRGASTSGSPAAQDLTTTSIEDLMNIDVTSVSKKDQKLSQVAAAIYVISQEDIHRSGATNIPDLLRMVPGLDVAQIDSNTWAISARGFNGQFADKLLVLIDGRAVYTPLFGGVNWDTTDMPLEDIERIEVTRGPGGSVWGANAVNGVINIITKPTQETRGGMAMGGGGTHDQAFGTIQYGGQFGANGQVGTGGQSGAGGQPSEAPAIVSLLNTSMTIHYPGPGGDGEDDWHLLHAGFRVDTSLSAKDSLTTQGDIYTGETGSIIVHSILFPPQNLNVEALAQLSGGNILGRWTHTFSSRSETELQVYFDRYTREGPESNEVRNTVDLDFHHHLLIGTRQDLIWGAGFRFSGDQTAGTIDQAFFPSNFDGTLSNFFVQDQIALLPGRVFWDVGSKLENDYFTGFDFEPTARVAWTPSIHDTVWIAVSNTSRPPTCREEGLNATLAALPGPIQVELLGNTNVKSENVVAYEIGYRAQPNKSFSVDVAGFINKYTDLLTVEPLSPFLDTDTVPTVTVEPESYANKMHGTTGGLEVSLNWRITDRWTINPGYALLVMRLHTDSTSLDTTSAAGEEGSNPTEQAQLRSRMDLFRNLTWNVNAYFVGALPAQFVRAYTRLDSLLTWQPEERLELSVVGQNLLSDNHLEFNYYMQSVNSTEVKRSAYAKITWKF